MAALEDVDSNPVAVRIEDVVVPRIGSNGVAALYTDHGDHVVVIGIDHSQLCRWTTDPEIEVVITRVEPDLVSSSNVGQELVGWPCRTSTEAAPLSQAPRNFWLGPSASPVGPFSQPGIGNESTSFSVSGSNTSMKPTESGELAGTAW